MFLDGTATADIVRIVTSSAADINVSADWADWPAAGGFTPGHTTTLITSAATTTVVAGPATSTFRQVKQLMLANRHASTANTVFVEHYDGTNAARVWSGTLAAGESVLYDGTKWVRINATGYIALEDTLVQYDGTTYLVANAGGGQGLVLGRHLIRADADETLTSATGAQAVFDSPANGRLTVAVGTYMFKFLYQFTGMSATSGNAAILFGGTGTFSNFMWWYNALEGSTALADDDAATLQANTTAASAATATTGTTLRVHGEGSFECTAAGTFIPQISLVTAAAAIVESGSYFVCERVGDTGLISIGSWD